MDNYVLFFVRTIGIGGNWLVAPQRHNIQKLSGSRQGWGHRIYLRPGYISSWRPRSGMRLLNTEIVPVRRVRERLYMYLITQTLSRKHPTV